MIEERTEEKEVEVIAEKSRKAAYVFLALSILGVAVAAVGIILFLTVGFKTFTEVMQGVIIGLTALGAVLLIVFSALYIRQMYNTYSLVVFTDGLLKFHDGTECNPSEITAVEKDKEKGKITLSLADRKIEINGVANCDKAYRKLCVLTGNPV